VATGGFFVQGGKAAANFETMVAARATVQMTVAALTTRSFAESKEQTYDVCDVYGVLVEGVGWYLKLCIDEAVPEVAIISFHPLEHPLRTNGGMVKPLGWTERKRK
jgi:hypothetical protein